MSEALNSLLTLCSKLRDPVDGSAWDRAQTYRSLTRYTIEEAYEVADAADRHDLPALKDELGDLLLQIVMYAQIAEAEGAFGFDDVADAIHSKLLKRHPNFTHGAQHQTEAEVKAAWDRNKAEQRAEQAAAGHSVLDDLPLALPALTRAVKMQDRMSSVGFQWGEASACLDKVEEEVRELRHEIEAGKEALIEEEYGDLLFVMIRLAQHLRIDPETALRHATAKVDRRFRHVEKRLAGERTEPGKASLETMLSLWNEAKAAEKLAEV